MNVGHCHPRVVEALKEQAELFSHTCFGLTGYEPYVRLAEKLDRLTPGDFEKRTFFVNSGAEAVENAIKVARYATGRKSIVAFEDGFQEILGHEIGLSIGRRRAIRNRRTPEKAYAAVG